MPTDREVPRILVAVRRVGGVDDLDARSVDRHRAGDRVLLLARPHRLGRQHHLLVADGGTADVHLAAVDVHAVRGPVDDVDVEVRIVLLARAPLAVPLGVRDALRAAQVVLAGVVDVLVDGLAVDRLQLRQFGCRRDEREQDDTRGPERHVTLALGEQPLALAELLDRLRHDVDRVELVRIIRMEAVVHVRSGLHSGLQPRFVGRIGDALAIEVREPPVLQGLLVLLTGHHHVAVPPAGRRRRVVQIRDRSGAYRSGMPGHPPRPRLGRFRRERSQRRHPLRVQAPADHLVADLGPAAVVVRREVADDVEDLHPILARDPVHRPEVLLHVVVRVRVLVVRDGRAGQQECAGRRRAGTRPSR